MLKTESPGLNKLDNQVLVQYYEEAVRVWR